MKPYCKYEWSALFLAFEQSFNPKYFSQKRMQWSSILYIMTGAFMLLQPQRA
ncbi:MAG: hypothetical protein ACI8VC_002623 [Candidatus Endobugula sp.]|jgi:hypothetical protein